MRPPTSKINREAFIIGPKTKERVKRLNEAVHDCEILPVVGIGGTGKKHFLDWWWQDGCANPAFAEDHPVQDDMIMVRARSATSTSISEHPGCKSVRHSV